MANENLEHPTKKTKVYIPCWKTIVDLISGDSESDLSVKTFFEYLSTQSSKGTSLQYREYPVTACRSYPIERKLYDLFYWGYDKTQNENLLRTLGLIFSTLTHMDYKSNLSLQKSIIELATILNDEFNVEIIIISNDENIKNVKEELVKDNPDTDFDCFTIMNTEEWLKKEIGDPEVNEALSKIL